MIRIGIDLGGTKIEAIALEQDGTESFRKRIPTPQDSYDHTLSAIQSLVSEVESELNQKAPHIGIGTPGAISPATGLLKNANSTWLNGKRMDKDLSQLLDRPVVMANDANCFTLSEATDGAAADAGIVFGVIIGTGTGGGICVDKKILTGVNAVSGEWGHNPLPWMREEERPGAECYCGKRGCIETFLSGPGLARDHKTRTGEKLSAEAIAESRPESMALYEDRLARALAGVINLLDPDSIVLGGGLSNIDRLYTNVPKLWEQYAFSDSLSTKLVKAKYGDSSGVRGAAWLTP